MYVNILHQEAAEGTGTCRVSQLYEADIRKQINMQEYITTVEQKLILPHAVAMQPRERCSQEC